MTQTIGFTELKKMLLAAVEIIRANKDELCKLDGVCGDGDHGVAVTRAMEAIESAIHDYQGENIADFVKAAGWGVMSIDGGSTGPLFGSFFMGMKDGAPADNVINGAAMAAMFAAGLKKVQKRTQAQPGDKTLIDTLVPAIEAATAAAESGDDLDVVVKKAADAAWAGSENTATMQAKFGRAKNLGEKSIGSIDPGSRSMALIFKAFAENI